MNSGEQELVPTDRILTVPNVLSIVRLLALPLFAYLLLVTHSDGWALALLMLSGFTDLARRQVGQSARTNLPSGSASRPARL